MEASNTLDSAKYDCRLGQIWCVRLHWSVLCTPDNHSETTVAGIDLDHSDIAGYLPEELGLLTDLALFHIVSNCNNS
ncbi:hypothetical protein L1987_60167 [Smallanthus sonchifolius]|uniref:Uncharacterized protein n=1 Tax=Smallanthus sonchifolius TaxID=185202 RepID=A0ACB9D7Q8_9ASTR|nr:hypothetical protein L1987_60167 [Smallanthus sonchifolius]